MKRARFTEEQVIGILKAAEAVGSQYRSAPELLSFSFRYPTDQHSMVVRIQTKNQSRSRQ